MVASIIEVPAMAGDPHHPAAEGPAAIAAALREAGSVLPIARVTVGAPTGDAVADSIRVGAQVKSLVAAAVAVGEMPVVLAGSCDVAPAVLAAIDRGPAGVVWIDAHADFNTPQSSVTGFWPGMTLAVVVGDRGENVWSELGGDPIAPERVLLVGVRSLSPDQEARRLRESQVLVVGWRGGLPQQDVDTALERLRQRADHVYLHLDLDALDPSGGRGAVDPRVAGGISRSQLDEPLGAIRDRLTVLAATIATYTPAKDDGETLPVVIDAIRQLSDPRG